MSFFWQSHFSPFAHVVLSLITVSGLERTHDLIYDLTEDDQIRTSLLSRHSPVDFCERGTLSGVGFSAARLGTCNRCLTVSTSGFSSLVYHRCISDHHARFGVSFFHVLVWVEDALEALQCCDHRLRVDERNETAAT